MITVKKLKTGGSMIALENLTKYYGTHCAVNKVNLDIPAGQILGLLGPNGAGKSTTLRMITGYLRPTEGSVKVKGLDVNEHPYDVKKEIGYLPESAPLYPEMIAYDYLQYTSEIRRVANSADRIRAVNDLCGLSAVMHKPIGSLSKGYKQRVGLAQTLLADPPILILDEPTSGLDPNQIVDIRSIIKEIGKQKTIVFSTHILSEAEATCDRVVIINGGIIVADGTTEMLKTMVRKNVSVRFTLKNGSNDDVKNVFGALSGVQSVEIQGKDDRISGSLLSTSEEITEQMYHVCREKNWIITELFQEQMSLENIFRELTKENQ
jgi:ABC-2 type transport system ATP-binding protein